MIYFVQSSQGGHIKIGTTQCLRRRLIQLRNAYGLMYPNLLVLAVLDGDRPEEQALHQRFSHLRVFDEWFNPNPDLLDYIRQKGRLWDPAEDKRLVTAKLDPEIHRIVKTVAAWEGVEVTDWLHTLVAPAARAALARIVKEQSGGGTATG